MKLKKELGLIHVFCIASGAMISSGIFVLPGLAHAQAGPAVVFSYLIAGLLATTGMLSIAELATAMPKAGGDYFFITRGMGPAFGSVAGLLTWFSLSLKTSFAIVGMSAFISLFWDVDIRVLGVGLCFLFVLINIFGTKHAGRLQVFLVIGLFILMFVFIVKGFPAIEYSRFRPFAPYGTHAVFLTAAFVFVAYGGLINVAGVAGEVKNPGKIIPLGLILSLIIVSIFYTLMVFITSGVLPADELDVSLTPIADAAGRIMGTWGRNLLGAAAMLAFISTANAGVMAASRYLLALSNDELLPPRIGKIHKRFQTPYIAIILTGFFISATLFLNLKILIESASLVLIVGYILSCCCVIIMRESNIQNYQPSFRSPFYPWPQILGIIGFSFLIFKLGMHAFAISAILVVAGSLIYWFYGRKKVFREFALLNIIEKITNKELVTGKLDSELKEIVRERDNIIMDRFDHIIASSPVLDVDEKITKNALFKQIAHRLSEDIDLDCKEIKKLLHKRENEGSTILMPHFALPHIIIPGEKTFKMVLVRCKKGVSFLEDEDNITIVFVLAGTKDERRFHLQVLAAIAQIVSVSDFEKRWMSAKNRQDLRDLLLLSKRHREKI